MDELDPRLKERLERLAEAAPVDPAPVTTAGLHRRQPTARARIVLASAAVVLVAVVLAGGLIGLGGRLASTSPTQSPSSGASIAAASPSPSPSAAAASPAPTHPTAALPTPVATVYMPPTGSPRYPDGIPMSWAGQKVYRGAAALAFAAHSTTSDPFYIGGWLTVEYGAFWCPFTQNPDSWTFRCGAPTLADEAGTLDDALNAAVTFKHVMDSPVTGPVVVEVHVHDPRAPECGSAAAACDKMMVADTVVWSGDAATDPQPISMAGALAALRAVHAGATLKLDGPGVAYATCADPLPGAQFLLADPLPATVPSVTALEALPTTAARQRALPQARGAAGAWTKAALKCQGYAPPGDASGASQDRWLVVANAAVMVHLHNPATAADRAFVARLAAALEQAASEPSPSSSPAAP